MRLLTTLTLLLTIASPAYAQDHLEVVEEVRADLVRRGIVPPGIANPGDNENPCRVFEITKRVAWKLRAEGAGLLSKTSGNNCQGYSMDWVVYPDGRGSDVAAGGFYPIEGGVPTDTVPTWNIEVIEDHGRRWKPAIDPGDVVGDPDLPTEPTISEQLNRMENKIDDIQAKLFPLYAHILESKDIYTIVVDEAKKQEEFRQAVRSEWAWLKSTGKAIAKYGPFVLGGLLSGKLFGGSE